MCGPNWLACNTIPVSLALHPHPIDDTKKWQPTYCCRKLAGRCGSVGVTY